MNRRPKKSYRRTDNNEQNRNRNTPPTYDFKKINESGNKKQPPKSENPEVRLNKYIADSGVCSRREADQHITNGFIKVNGKVISELGYKVRSSDKIQFKGKILKREKYVYVLLNKPKDYITTTKDPEKRRTVMNLVSEACEERIYPVGRLDRNTTGLLLLTNDGPLAKKLTHPSGKVQKLYQVELDKPITKEHFETILEGLELKDGKAIVDEMAIVGSNSKVIGIKIHIGKNRIIRRIFEHLGYEVEKLDRVMFGSLTKKDLPRGKWRFLTQKEVIQLKHFV